MPGNTTRPCDAVILSKCSFSYNLQILGLAAVKELGKLQKIRAGKSLKCPLDREIISGSAVLATAQGLRQKLVRFGTPPF